MRHRLWSFALVLGLGVFLATLGAQGPARPDAAVSGPRVGVADRQALERAATDVGAESSEAFQKRQMGALAPIQDTIRVLQKRIIDGGEALAADAREEILGEIRQRQEELRKADQATKDELHARTARHKNLVADHLAKVAEKHGLDVVLDRSDAVVLWTSHAIDLTNEVITSMRQAVVGK